MESSSHVRQLLASTRQEVQSREAATPSPPPPPAAALTSAAVAASPRGQTAPHPNKEAATSGRKGRDKRGASSARTPSPLVSSLTRGQYNRTFFTNTPLFALPPAGGEAAEAEGRQMPHHPMEQGQPRASHAHVQPLFFRPMPPTQTPMAGPHSARASVGGGDEAFLYDMPRLQPYTVRSKSLHTSKRNSRAGGMGAQQPPPMHPPHTYSPFGLLPPFFPPSAPAIAVAQPMFPTFTLVQNQDAQTAHPTLLTPPSTHAPPHPSPPPSAAASAAATHAFFTSPSTSHLSTSSSQARLNRVSIAVKGGPISAAPPHPNDPQSMRVELLEFLQSEACNLFHTMLQVKGSELDAIIALCGGTMADTFAILKQIDAQKQAQFDSFPALIETVRRQKQKEQPASSAHDSIVKVQLRAVGRHAPNVEEKSAIPSPSAVPTPPASRTPAASSRPSRRSSTHAFATPIPPGTSPHVVQVLQQRQATKQRVLQYLSSDECRLLPPSVDPSPADLPPSQKDGAKPSPPLIQLPGRQAEIDPRDLDKLVTECGPAEVMMAYLKELNEQIVPVSPNVSNRRIKGQNNAAAVFSASRSSLTHSFESFSHLLQAVQQLHAHTLKQKKKVRNYLNQKKNECRLFMREEDEMMLHPPAAAPSTERLYAPIGARKEKNGGRPDGSSSARHLSSTATSTLVAPPRFTLAEMDRLWLEGGAGSNTWKMIRMLEDQGVRINNPPYLQQLIRWVKQQQEQRAEEEAANGRGLQIQIDSVTPVGGSSPRSAHSRFTLSVDLTASTHVSSLRSTPTSTPRHALVPSPRSGSGPPSTASSSVQEVGSEDPLLSYAALTPRAQRFLIELTAFFRSPYTKLFVEQHQQQQQVEAATKTDRSSSPRTWLLQRKIQTEGEETSESQTKESQAEEQPELPSTLPSPPSPTPSLTDSLSTADFVQLMRAAGEQSLLLSDPPLTDPLLLSTSSTNHALFYLTNINRDINAPATSSSVSASSLSPFPDWSSLLQAVRAQKEQASMHQSRLWEQLLHPACNLFGSMEVRRVSDATWARGHLDTHTNTPHSTLAEAAVPSARASKINVHAKEGSERSNKGALATNGSDGVPPSRPSSSSDRVLPLSSLDLHRLYFDSGAGARAGEMLDHLQSAGRTFSDVPALVFATKVAWGFTLKKEREEAEKEAKRKKKEEEQARSGSGPSSLSPAVLMERHGIMDSQRPILPPAELEEVVRAHKGAHAQQNKKSKSGVEQPPQQKQAQETEKADSSAEQPVSLLVSTPTDLLDYLNQPSVQQLLFDPAMLPLAIGEAEVDMLLQAVQQEGENQQEKEENKEEKEEEQGENQNCQLLFSLLRSFEASATQEPSSSPPSPSPPSSSSTLSPSSPSPSSSSSSSSYGPAVPFASECFVPSALALPGLPSLTRKFASLDELVDQLEVEACLSKLKQQTLDFLQSSQCRLLPETVTNSGVSSSYNRSTGGQAASSVAADSRLLSPSHIDHLFTTSGAGLYTLSILEELQQDHTRASDLDALVRLVRNFYQANFARLHEQKAVLLQHLTGPLCKLWAANTEQEDHASQLAPRRVTEAHLDLLLTSTHLSGSAALYYLHQLSLGVSSSAAAQGLLPSPPFHRCMEIVSAVRSCMSHSLPFKLQLKNLLTDPMCIVLNRSREVVRRTGGSNGAGTGGAVSESVVDRLWDMNAAGVDALLHIRAMHADAKGCGSLGELITSVGASQASLRSSGSDEGAKLSLFAYLVSPLVTPTLFKYQLHDITITPKHMDNLLAAAGGQAAVALFHLEQIGREIGQEQQKKTGGRGAVPNGRYGGMAPLIAHVAERHATARAGDEALHAFLHSRTCRLLLDATPNPLPLDEASFCAMVRRAHCASHQLLSILQAFNTQQPPRRFHSIEEMMEAAANYQAEEGSVDDSHSPSHPPTVSFSLPSSADGAAYSTAPLSVDPLSLALPNYADGTLPLDAEEGVAGRFIVVDESQLYDHDPHSATPLNRSAPNSRPRSAAEHVRAAAAQRREEREQTERREKVKEEQVISEKQEDGVDTPSAAESPADSTVASSAPSSESASESAPSSEPAPEPTSDSAPSSDSALSVDSAPDLASAPAPAPLVITAPAPSRLRSHSLLPDSPAPEPLTRALSPSFFLDPATLPATRDTLISYLSSETCHLFDLSDVESLEVDEVALDEMLSMQGGEAEGSIRVLEEMDRRGRRFRDFAQLLKAVKEGDKQEETQTDSQEDTADVSAANGNGGAEANQAQEHATSSPSDYVQPLPSPGQQDEAEAPAQAQEEKEDAHEQQAATSAVEAQQPPASATVAAPLPTPSASSVAPSSSPSSPPLPVSDADRDLVIDFLSSECELFDLSVAEGEEEPSMEVTAEELDIIIQAKQGPEGCVQAIKQLQEQGWRVHTMQQLVQLMLGQPAPGAKRVQPASPLAEAVTAAAAPAPLFPSSSYELLLSYLSDASPTLFAPLAESESDLEISEAELDRLLLAAGGQAQLAVDLLRRLEERQVGVSSMEELAQQMQAEMQAAQAQQN